MKERTGYVYFDQQKQRWTARITFTDQTGKRKNLKRVAESEPEAEKILRKLLNELETKGEKIINSEKMTFSELAEEYRAFKVKPAEYRNDKKISGLRSYDKVEYRITALISYFGKTRIASITPATILKFKEVRLNTKTKRGKDRSIASVNRELEVLRAILRYAKGEGLITRSPFENSPTPLISKAEEEKRDRILTKDEEAELLAACGEGSPREHLRPIIIAALDTGCRKGELLCLTWNEIDFDSRIITIKAMTTKTLQARIVPISDRLLQELKTIREKFPDRQSVFGVSSKFQHSWETACKIAKLDNLRFHDLRATFCTRLIEAGLAIEIVAKISGHAQLETLYKHYLRRNQITLNRATELLNRMNS